MKKNRIKWEQITPAYLSSLAYSPDYFALTYQNKLYTLNKISGQCLFTSVIQASVSVSLSLYELEIWIGYKKEMSPGEELNTVENKKNSFLSLLNWSSSLIDSRAGGVKGIIPIDFRSEKEEMFRRIKKPVLAG